MSAYPLRFESLDLRLPAAAAAAVVFGTSAGDGFVAVVALLVAAGPTVGATAALAMAAMVARWGTTDLGAVAGDQAVLGAAVGTGSVATVASSLLAAAGLVLAARRRDERWAGWMVVLALGLGAAIVAAGPSPVGGAEVLVRLVATLAAVGAAVGVAVLAERRPTLEPRLTTASLGAAGIAVLLAVAG